MNISNEICIRRTTMNRSQLGPDNLIQIVSGDALHMKSVSCCEHVHILRVADDMPSEQLTVTPSAVRRVLLALLGAEITAEQAQAWASFIKRGYLPTKRGGHIRPINFDYQEDHLDAIAAAISRLDELGDLIDGTIDDNELRNLIERLDA
jgi:hypothetical protein